MRGMRHFSAKTHAKPTGPGVIFQIDPRPDFYPLATSYDRAAHAHPRRGCDADACAIPPARSTPQNNDGDHP